MEEKEEIRGPGQIGFRPYDPYAPHSPNSPTTTTLPHPNLLSHPPFSHTLTLPTHTPTTPHHTTHTFTYPPLLLTGQVAHLLLLICSYCTALLLPGTHSHTTSLTPCRSCPTYTELASLSRPSPMAVHSLPLSSCPPISMALPPLLNSAYSPPLFSLHVPPIVVPVFVSAQRHRLIDARCRLSAHDRSQFCAYPTHVVLGSGGTNPALVVRTTCTTKL